MRRLGSEAVRWGVKAVGGLALNLLLLTLWVDGLGIPAWLAIVPNWVLLSVAGYLVADRWVFTRYDAANTARGHLRQFVGSESIMLASKTLNYGIYIGLLTVVDYRIAWVSGAVVAFGLTFGLNRLWWKRNAGTGTC